MPAVGSHLWLQSPAIVILRVTSTDCNKFSISKELNPDLEWPVAVRLASGTGAERDCCPNVVWALQEGKEKRGQKQKMAALERELADLCVRAEIRTGKG